MLDESSEADWCYRREPHIHRPLSTIVRQNSTGLPYLVPEIQLLYKAGSGRLRDEHDFDAVIPSLDDAPRVWLRSALSRADPDHRWVARLDELIATDHIRY